VDGSSTVRWTFSALADLTAREATTEKVVHQLAVHNGTSVAGAR
jgi:hypothetical protein